MKKIELYIKWFNQPSAIFENTHDIGVFENFINTNILMATTIFSERVESINDLERKP
jgi:hypothetical protein